MTLKSWNELQKHLNELQKQLKRGLVGNESHVRDVWIPGRCPRRRVEDGSSLGVLQPKVGTSQVLPRRLGM